MTADEIGRLPPSTSSQTVQRKKRATRDSNREERARKNPDRKDKRLRIDELV